MTQETRSKWLPNLSMTKIAKVENKFRTTNEEMALHTMLAPEQPSVNDIDLRMEQINFAAPLSTTMTSTFASLSAPLRRWTTKAPAQLQEWNGNQTAYRKAKI